MLDICYTSGSAVDIIFNAKKSLFIIGKAHGMALDVLIEC